MLEVFESTRSNPLEPRCCYN